MAEFVGEESISVSVDEPITFENKTDTTFDVGCGIVFHKSGLYRVSIVGKYISVTVEPERKTGHWINAYPDIEPNPMFMYGICSECGFEQSISDKLNYCPNCGSYNGG